MKHGNARRKRFNMLYSEFVEGTGCKENEHNYKVYKNLEIMYMNSDMSKQEIYEYGKKLVDNSKSEKEIELENTLKAQLAELKEQYRWYMSEAKRCKAYYKEDKDRYWKGQAEHYTQLARTIGHEIQGTKWVLGI